jgi:uncharacterized protein YerC
MTKLTEEMLDFLDDCFSQEELKEMSDKEKVEFCLLDNEYSARSYDDLIALQGRY